MLNSANIIRAWAAKQVRKVWRALRVAWQRRGAPLSRSGEQRRLLRGRIEALRQSTLPEHAFFDYISLLGEVRYDEKLRQELHSVFRQDWLAPMRQQLGRHLRASEFDVARRWVAQLRWEWQESLSEGAPLAIQTLIHHLEEPTIPPPEKVVQQVLEGFGWIGLEATEPVVKWLAGTRPSLEIVEEVLFRKGGTIGRYLLRRWGERDGEVQARLEAWEVGATPRIRHGGGPCALWPRQRGESLVIQQGVSRLELDLNPFGPEKAEQDPMLPDLFYRMPPVWQEVSAPKPGVVVVPPGCGRSALMWMIRYESELIGSALERIISVPIPLHSPLQLQELDQVVQRASFRSLCCAMARDPYTFLGLEQVEQVALSEFLIQAAGGLPPLLLALKRVGLSPSHPDTQLLQEALSWVSHRSEGWGGDMARSPVPTGAEYDLGALRALLGEAFAPAELLRFCQDHPNLRPVLIDLGPRATFAEIIDAVVGYCLRHDLLGDLLRGVQAFNPRQYARYGEWLHGGERWRHGVSAGISQLPLPLPHGCEYIFLLIDVSFQDVAAIDTLLESVFERWLPSLAPRHVVPKVFLSAEPDRCTVAPIRLEWTREALHNLLHLRLERAGLVLQAGQPLLEAWVDDVEEADWLLVDQAAGSPKRLMQLGNRLICRLAEHKALEQAEFLSILDTRAGHR